jgi:SnoaL-like domain
MRSDTRRLFWQGHQKARDTARAMSQEQLEVISRVLAFFNSGGDAELAEELIEPEAKFEPLLAGVEGEYRGPAGVMKWLSELNEMFEEVHGDFSRIEEFGEVILATGKMTGRGRGSGVSVEQDLFAVARFRKGRVAYAGVRLTRAEALDAVGLKE